MEKGARYEMAERVLGELRAGRDANPHSSDSQVGLAQSATTIPILLTILIGAVEDQTKALERIFHVLKLTSLRDVALEKEGSEAHE